MSRTLSPGAVTPPCKHSDGSEASMLWRGPNSYMEAPHDCEEREISSQATSCSLLAQLQPSSNCKMHKRSKNIQTSPSFPVPQKLWDNKTLAVLSTASDVLGRFFKKIILGSPGKKIQICAYCLHGVNPPTIANLQLPLWWLSSWEEMPTAGSANRMSWLQCIEPKSSAKDRPLCRPKWSPGRSFKVPSPVYVIEPRAMWYWMCDAQLC